MCACPTPPGNLLSIERMLVLVINCGSSSVKADVIDLQDGRRVHTMRVERLGGDARVIHGTGAPEPLKTDDCGVALREQLPRLLAELADMTITAVGHRVVHGGERFAAPVLVDAQVEAAIDELRELAPLHNPSNLAGITVCRELLPDVPHVAVFDTAFHATLPPRARTYAVPTEMTKAHGVRRYGFHGTSHGWVATRAAAFVGEPTTALRMISCHLGNGASVAAVEYGRSVETSMGMTPLEGLVMGTRAGDIDAGALLHLMRAEGLDVEGADELLNRRSGLAGLSGIGKDVRDIEAAAAEGNDACRLALRVYCHRIRKYIGAYAAVMGGVDAIVFTAGVGENSALIRHMVAQRLEFLGARLDEDLNRGAQVDNDHPVVEISVLHSRTRLLVVKTDEAHAIARHTAAVAKGADRVRQPRAIPIAVSARHIHLTQATVESLFGAGHQLTERSPLSQPGQFACEETLTVIGPKRSLEGVRVLGPVRGKNQVEISRTDEFWLGVDAPVRPSGDVANTPGITLQGPAGTVTLDQGLICAARHIHMTPTDAEEFGVQQGDVAEVAVNSPGRDLVFGDVLVRVSPKYRLEMHVDTDEANAAELARNHEGMLVRTAGTASLRRKQVT